MSAVLNIEHYVGGKRIADEPELESINPSNTADVVARFPDDASYAVRMAVGAAVEAYPSWSNATPEQRSDALERIAALILDRRDVLGRLLARDPAWKSAPALAFGNTVVLKPSELTPAIVSALTDIVHEAGVPPGVFNVVFGGRSTGRALVEHPDVAGISFTGSQAAGATIAQAAAARQARVQLEMGGKNALVVLDDADPERAVQCALDGAFFGTGQRCTASSRLIVTERIHDRFESMLRVQVASLRVGDALDPTTQIGPLASAAQLDRTLSYLDLAEREGTRLVVGGEPLRRATPGHYIQPALLADTHADMRINTEEIFGPVASIIKVTDYEGALRAANAGSFGLSAGIVTGSLSCARHFVRHARAGMVMVNLPTAGVDYHVPFGGTRKSSYGPREQGTAAVEFFTSIKTAYTWA